MSIAGVAKRMFVCGNLYCRTTGHLPLTDRPINANIYREEPPTRNIDKRTFMSVYRSVTTRIDARRHRQTLLAAAREVFLQYGITAPLELVVEQSGLGRATLYRHFPDRASLALAIASESLEDLFLHAGTEDGRCVSLQDLFSRLARSQISNPFLADVWRVASSRAEESRELADRFCTMFEAPIRHAIIDGTCRTDLRASDMFLIVAMLGTSIREPDSEARQRMVERMKELIADGLWIRAPS